MAYVPISSITRDSKNIRWDFINTRKPDQIFSFDLLLIDEHGDTIHGTIPNEIAEKFRSLLVEGNIYHISGFDIISAQATYRPSANPLRLKLPYNASVKKVEEDTTPIPYERFNFLNFDSVKERIGHIDYLCDTFGLLIDMGRNEQVRAKDQIKNKRMVLLKNISGDELQVTLWAKMASEFPEDYIVAIAKDKPVIIAFVGMIVTPYKGSYSVNTTAASRFYINPGIPEIIEFSQMIPPPYPQLKKIETKLPEIAGIETEKDVNRKKISELLQIDIHTDKAIMFTCKATIKAIDPTEGWWYRACPRCKSGLQNFDNKIWCRKCEVIKELPIPWYRLKVIVEDDSGIAQFIVFGHMAAELIGIPANNLTSIYKDRHEIPPPLTKIYGMQKIFQIQLSNTVKDESDITFNVMYIFKESLLTPKKEYLCPITAPSAHLTSPMAPYTHKPTTHQSLQINDTSAINQDESQQASKKRHTNPSPSSSKETPEANSE